MYESHFGLKQRPFRPLADLESYYPATCHEQALGQVMQALADEESICLVAGSAGTGKTVFCHRLFNELHEEHCCSFLTLTHFSGRAGLLEVVADDLGIQCERRTEESLRLALAAFALQNYQAGKRTVLIMDEAQSLTAELLDELRLVTNLEGRAGKAIQVVLVGLPSILEAITAPEMTSFQQRLAIQASLECLDVHESGDYLQHHLRSAGARRLFTDEAIDILARAAQGIPRLLSRAGHQALLIACSAGVHEVDAEVALEAAAVLGMGDPCDDLEAETLTVTGAADVKLPA
jgi:type II secretory pathway predicted ATPase ExeA